MEIYYKINLTFNIFCGIIYDNRHICTEQYYKLYKELIIPMNKIYQKILIYITTFTFSLFFCGCKNNKINKDSFVDGSYEFLKTDSAFSTIIMTKMK